MFSKTLASYRNSLDEVSRRRYDEKCALIGKIDPYVLEKSKWSNDVKMWASVSYPDIVNFLLFSTSAYTMTQLKSYKSLDAYNQFINGWVRDSVVHCVNNMCLHAAKVLHDEPAELHEMTTVRRLNMEGKPFEEAGLMESPGCCQDTRENREASLYGISDYSKLGSIHQPEGSSYSQHQQMFGKLFQGAESNNPLLHLAYASCECPVEVPAISGAHVQDKIIPKLSKPHSCPLQNPSSTQHMSELMRPLNLKTNAVEQLQSHSLPVDCQPMTSFYSIKDSSSIKIWKDLEGMDMQIQTSKYPKHSQERFGTGPSMRKRLGDITNTNLQQLSQTDLAQGLGTESQNFRYHGERGNERRERHNQLERERRKRIRSCCDEMNYLVPFCTPETDKATTLQWTTGFLMYIQEKYGEDIKKGFENMFQNKTAEQSSVMLKKAWETKLKNPAT